MTNSDVKEIKTRITLDNGTKFKSELKAVDSQLKVLASEVKLISASFDKSSATVKNYTDLSAALSKQIEQQKVKTTALKTAVADQADMLAKARERATALTKEFGENSRQAKNAEAAVRGHERQLEKYQTQLANAEAQLNKLNVQYQNNEREAKNLNAVTKELGKAFESLTSPSKALVAIAGISFAATSSGIQSMKSAIDNLSNSLKNISTATITALTNEVKLSEQAFADYEKSVNDSLVAVAKSATQTAGSFEQEMSKVRAYSNLEKTSEEFKKLEEAALSTGSITSKTANEAAQALGFMSLAGWDTTKKLEALLPVVHASEAGNMDLALTSQLVTQSMASLGLETERLDEYLNKITAAQNNSNTSMQGMMEAYVTAGGMLKELNVPLTESATILGRLADQGIYGSEAGHKLNSILVNLVGANKNAATAMTDLGVSAWDSNGRFIGLTNTLKLLGEALDSATDEDKVKFEAKIGGKLQLNTLQKLIAGVDDRYTELFAIIEKSDGILENTTDIMLDNFKGAATIMQSALEGMSIAVGKTLFLGEFREVAETLTYYLGLIGRTVENGGMLGLANSFTQFKKSISRDIKEMIPDFVEFYDEYHQMYNKLFSDTLDIGINVAPDLLSGVIPVVTESFDDLAERIVDKADKIVPIMSESGSELVGGIVTGMSRAMLQLSAKLPSIVNGTIGSLSANLGNSLTLFIGDNLYIIDNILDTINQTLNNSEFISNVSNTVRSILRQTTKMLPELLESGRSIVDSLLKGIGKELPYITAMFKQNITNTFNSIGSLADTLAQNSEPITDFVIGTFEAIGGGIMNNLPKLLDSAQKIINELSKGLTDNAELIGGAAADIVISLVEFIGDNVGWILDAALLLIEGLATELTKPDNLSRLVLAANTIINSLVEELIKHTTLLAMAASEIVISLGTYLTTPQMTQDLISVGEELLNSILDGLDDNDGAIQRSVDRISESLGKWISNTDWSVFGKQILVGMFNNNPLSFEQLGENVVDYLTNNDDVKSWFDDWKPKPIDHTWNPDDYSAQDNFNYFASASTQDIEKFSNKKTTFSDNASETARQFGMLDAGSTMNGGGWQVQVRNYLYPNGQELASTVAEANVMYNVITGGR